jgi:uncharacterized membrane protein HdeD (DUF308 family)
VDDRQEVTLKPYVKDVAEIRQNWGTFFAIGVLLVILGTAALVFNVFTTYFSILFLGILLIISGAAQIAQSFLARKWSGLFQSLLMGILSIIVGFFCVAKPGVTAAGLTLLISTLLLVGGLFRMISSAILRFEQWGWVFFNGLVTFILGLMIFADWPVTGLWVIGMFIGIDMILSGWAWIILYWSALPESNLQ